MIAIDKFLQETKAMEATSMGKATNASNNGKGGGFSTKHPKDKRRILNEKMQDDSDSSIDE